MFLVLEELSILNNQRYVSNHSSNQPGVLKCSAARDLQMLHLLLRSAPPLPEEVCFYCRIQNPAAVASGIIAKINGVASMARTPRIFNIPAGQWDSSEGEEKRKGHFDWWARRLRLVSICVNLHEPIAGGNRLMAGRTQVSVPWFLQGLNQSCAANDLDSFLWKGDFLLFTERITSGCIAP